jgi:hypothetical protein
MSNDSHRIDVRGPRFGAVVTTIVLAIALATTSIWVLAVQAVIFGLGAFLGPRYAPYGVCYAKLVRPRIGPPTEFEDDRPPRFAQLVGFVFAGVGVIGYAVGLPALGVVATASALIAAFLNAAFGLCLGCELYLLAKRLTARADGASS